MSHSEYKILMARLDRIEARQKTTDRKLGEVLRRIGMSDAEVEDFEIEEAEDILEIKEILTRRIAQRQKGVAA